MSKGNSYLDTPLTDAEIDRLLRNYATFGDQYVTSGTVIRLINEVRSLRESHRQLIDLANTMAEAGTAMLNLFIDPEYADKIKELTNWAP